MPHIWCFMSVTIPVANQTIIQYFEFNSHIWRDNNVSTDILKHW